MKHTRLALNIALLLCTSLAAAQQAIVPPLVNFSGVLTDVNGKPLTGITGVTFSLYVNQQGGSPLWIETQNVQPDSSGHYSVMLGSTSSTGLPAGLFASGEAHWLGVQVQGQAEQPRVMLLSVPYALKAGDAQTVGGLPPTAFLLAAGTNGTSTPPSSSGAGNGSPAAGTGTTDFIPIWIDSSGDLGNSAVFQAGSSPTARVGINTTTPAANLDVKGSGAIRGQLSVLGLFSLGPTSTATATKGFNSQATNQVASAFNSSTGKAVNQTFQWQAEPANNNTGNPSGTLNLLFGEGVTPSETGLNIASNGKITFATGQTFPGAGTITGVTAGTDLTGGGTTGAVTLNVDTTKVPQLNAANAFVGNQTVTGNLTDTGNITATGSVNAQTETLTTSGAQSALTINAATNSTGINILGNAGTGILITAQNNALIANTITTINPNAIQGNTTGGIAVLAQDDAGDGPSTGVLGSSNSNGGTGVSGVTTGNLNFPTEQPVGVYGVSSGIGGMGVEGVSTGPGGLGASFSGGPSSATSPAAPGLQAFGGADSLSYVGGAGGYMKGGDSTAIAGDGGDFAGGDGTVVPGDGIFAAAGVGPGFFGDLPAAGVIGAVGPNLNGPGVFGSDTYTSSTGSANYSNVDIGVWGDAGDSLVGNLGFAGVVGSADDTYAIVAANNSNTLPALKARNRSTSNTAPGLLVAVDSLSGSSIIGGAGCSNGSYWGLQLGQSGMSGCKNYTVLGDGVNTFINAGSSSTAGTINFRINNGSNAMTVTTSGSVTIPTLDVTKSLTKPAGSFKIDHPLDPANKYLYHSFVESPDMKNIYDGVSALDQNGEAVVVLPEYFQALNSDFRYQLTSIGAPGPNLYIAEEVRNNQFKIAGGKPGAKVSWQVTGIRQDAFANAYRIQAEVEKAPEDRGHYLHPELFGAPESDRIGYAMPAPPEYAKGDALERKPHPSAAAISAAVAKHQRLIRRRPPMPVLPKLPTVKTHPKPLTTRAAK